MRLDLVAPGIVGLLLLFGLPLFLDLFSLLQVTLGGVLVTSVGFLIGNA